MGTEAAGPLAAPALARPVEDGTLEQLKAARWQLAALHRKLQGLGAPQASLVALEAAVAALPDPSTHQPEPCGRSSGDRPCIKSDRINQKLEEAEADLERGLVRVAKLLEEQQRWELDLEHNGSGESAADDVETFSSAGSELQSPTHSPQRAAPQWSFSGLQDRSSEPTPGAAAAGSVVAPLEEAEPGPASADGSQPESRLVAGALEDMAGALSARAVEHAWVMKRDWTDTDFQAGEQENRKVLQSYEDELVSTLQRSCERALGAEAMPMDALPSEVGDVGDNVLARVLVPLTSSRGGPRGDIRAAVLDDPVVLGSSLDIVGAYLKNYEVDRAAAVIETVLPACRQRGGLWLLKCLNHLATVRMKQARPAEALASLQEIEACAHERLRPEDHDEAWEFWETVYRNFGWALSSLGREDEAIGYIQRAIDVKERVGKPPSWFDLWDLGRMKAVRALKDNDAARIKESKALVNKALKLHQVVEPSDLVMRAKIWHSVGEMSFALGHLEEGALPPDGSANAPTTSSAAREHYRKALTCFKESHKLFKKTEGRYNPLTGGEAQAASWSLLKLGDPEGAKEFLFDALESTSRQQSGWGEGDRLDQHAPALVQAMQSTERILDAHRATEDRDGLVRYFPAIERLCANVCGRLRPSKDRADALVYEKLVSSCSIIMVASGTDEGIMKSQQLLRDYMWDSPSNMQAQLTTQWMLSLKDGAPPLGELPDGTRG